MLPKISIITAVYNAERFLESLIKSVIVQDYVHYEYIIIDGDSSDKTVEIIKKYEKHISYWISEKDVGIYDAWNKGLRKATGDWIMFLGSDDILLPKALSEYVSYLNDRTEHLDYICSKLLLVNKVGNPIRVKGCPWNWNEFRKVNHLAHPGSLHNRSLFSRYGYYSLSYKINSDYEFLLRPGKDLKAGFVNTVTVIMRDGGASSTVEALKEHRKIIITQIGRLYGNIFSLFLFLKYYTKKLFQCLGLNLYLRKAFKI